ncbi:MAG: hypothetical protein GC181_10185 [Bacteroidetes bacterium]|nr:hypothetical protein [Bacteroidota bacterium]
MLGFVFCGLVPGLQAHTIHVNAHEIAAPGIGVEIYRDANDVALSRLVNGEVAMTPNADRGLNFGNTSDNIWLRFDVDNQSGEDLFVEPGNPELDLIECFIVRNHHIDSIQAGMQFPFNRRYLHSNKIILPIGKENATIYLRLKSGSSMYFPLYVGTIRTLSTYIHFDDLFNGAVVGVMLILLLYNLFLFLSVREKLYVLYCLYLFMSAAMMFVLEGLHFDLFWPAHVEWNNPHLPNIIVSFTVAAGIWFSSSFLRMREQAPLLHIINLTLAGLLCVGVILELSGKRMAANEVVQLASGLTSLYLLITGLYFLFRGRKEAKFYVLSWGGLVIGAVIYVLTINGALPIRFFTLNSFQLGSVFEGVMLSLALADRINTFRKEKHIAQKAALAESQKNEQLIRDQNIVLEQRVNERTKQLQLEMDKSESLLLNILPREVAMELKEAGASEARHYSNVTVLFTDFVNFTGVGERLSPSELVHELDLCFKAFDEIIGKYGIEKIKTIGDAYLAVAGLPRENPEHAVSIVRAAIEIRDFIEEYNQKGGVFRIRIGINSGPVVAGIVGVKKFAYDIWGDTVNTAARMEQNSEPGKINISETTYNLVKDHFNCEPRGMIEARNKGKVEMYFVG